MIMIMILLFILVYKLFSVDRFFFSFLIYTVFESTGRHFDANAPKQPRSIMKQQVSIALSDSLTNELSRMGFFLGFSTHLFRHPDSRLESPTPDWF